MSERLVYIDHDGTLTDSQKEMTEYSDIVTEYNAQKLGLTNQESELFLNTAKEKILKNPENYGWKWGKDQSIVAPATSDHYLFNQVATGLILTQMGKDAVESDKYINELFAACAPKLGVFYRPEAKTFLTELAKQKEADRWAIVTNSNALKIAEKLTLLHLNFDPVVVGGAKKMEINRNWIGMVPVGPYKGFPGYPNRGIELQRETFYNTLKKEAGEELPRMIFVEDIAEFVSWIDFLSENNDEWNEAATALVLTPNTPYWEKNRYLGDHKNRFASNSLMEILSWIEKQ